jgi:hypothetical protein
MSRQNPNYTTQALIGAMNRGARMGGPMEGPAASGMRNQPLASGGRTAGTFANPSRTGFPGERGTGVSAVPNGSPHLMQPPTGNRASAGSSSKIVPASRSAFRLNSHTVGPSHPSFGSLADPRPAGSAGNLRQGVPNAPRVNRGGGIPRAEVGRANKKDFVY